MARKKVEEIIEEVPDTEEVPEKSFPRFRTPLHCSRDEHERVVSNVGSPVHLIYAPIFDEKGKYHLEVKGKENIYDFIQSFKESVDINVILKRFMMGDTSALSRRQAMYIDTLDMPKTYAELLNVVNGAQEVFDTLTIEQKEQFNNSFAEFIAAFDDGNVLEKLNIPVQNSTTEGDGSIE